TAERPAFVPSLIVTTAPSMPVSVVGADSVTRPVNVTEVGEGAAFAPAVDVGASGDVWAPLHADPADATRTSERSPKRMARTPPVRSSGGPHERLAAVRRFTVQPASACAPSQPADGASTAPM